MIYLIVFSTVAGAFGLVVFIFLAMQYRSLQAWRIDHNSNLKKGTTLTAEEIVEMLQKSRPLPVDTLQGWTLYSFDNGTRIWWHNFSISGTNITVFASFGGVSVPTMAVFQVLKDISHTWSWKPGVMSTSYILRSTNKQKGDPRSSPSLSTSAHSSKSSNYDVIAEEHLKQVPDKSKSHRLPCQPQITDTVTVTLQRYWDCDSGGGWLLETNEKTGDWTVYIVQPIKVSKQSDVAHYHSPHARNSAPYTFQCLITVLVHEQLQSPVVTAALTSRLLGSLQNFFQYRKVVAPTFPYVLFQVDAQRVALQRSISLKKSSNPGDTRFLHHVRSFLEKRSDSKSFLSKEDRQKTEDILRPQTYNFIDEEINAELAEADIPMSSASSPPTTSTTGSATPTTSNPSSASSSAGAKHFKDEKAKFIKTTEEKENSVNTDLDNSKNYEHPPSMVRSVSYETSCNIPTNIPQNKDHQFVYYQTIANESAATLLKELTLSSNISLGTSSDDHDNSLTGGWVFCGLDDDVVILRKLSEEVNNIQSFMGKGVIHVPPKVVWDTVRNPKAKFAYDESLKKVDILEAFVDSLKVVYFYHEIVGLFRKDCCDACVILSERTENNRFILSMKSVNYDKAPTNENATRVTIQPSGWIIEPIVKDNKLCSMVTYIVQMDFGSLKTASEKYPFEELVARQPLSIADLRRYLRSVVVWARRHSTPARS